MSAADISASKSVARNAAIRASVKGMAKGGLTAAAIEAPIAGIENFLHWKRGRKTGKQATTDAAKSTAGAGAIGIVTTAATASVAKGVALVGISPTLGPAGIPLAVAGAGLMIGTTAYRLYRAAKYDFPLDEFYLLFCTRSCAIEYAWEISRLSRKRTWWTSAIDEIRSFVGKAIGRG